MKKKSKKEIILPKGVFNYEDFFKNAKLAGKMLKTLKDAIYKDYLRVMKLFIYHSENDKYMHILLLKDLIYYYKLL